MWHLSRAYAALDDFRVGGDRVRSVRRHRQRRRDAGEARRDEGVGMHRRRTSAGPPARGMVAEDERRGGWCWARFRDGIYNSEIVLKPASGTAKPATWLFTHVDPARHLPWITQFSPCLTVSDARKLVVGLQKFINAASARAPRRGPSPHLPRAGTSRRNPAR